MEEWQQLLKKCWTKPEVLRRRTNVSGALTRDGEIHTKSQQLTKMQDRVRTMDERMRGVATTPTTTVHQGVIGILFRKISPKHKHK
ncbi:hypothetical protein V6N13_015230 [Hibiscus sabdariffa]|uniref:Uncharacterized protein n=2 Tax=Hibiscus sabdariffa TaxID=183260 RepID=A0ABR2N6P5_9ROSI